MEIKWMVLDNVTGTGSLARHGFKHLKRVSRYSEPYDSNVSLCGKIVASVDGQSGDDFANLKDAGYKPHDCCRTCEKIHKNNLSPSNTP